MDAQKVTEHIISWLKTYATRAGVKGFVVGVSGGIDSAATSTLCAATGFPTLCVEMPIHQAHNQSPGNIGGYIGWQIVRSFMKQNDVSLQKLITMDAQRLLDQSKYKPRK